MRAVGLCGRRDCAVVVQSCGQLLVRPGKGNNAEYVKYPKQRNT